MSETLVVDPARPDPAIIARAADVIRWGGLVAFPTETVYGLGANALDAAAVQRIFDAKGRPAYNPLIVHVPRAEAARELVTDWPAAAEQLATAFWPGPLTLVLPKRDLVPDLVTAGLPAVAIRIPRHPVALALLAASQLPIAAPSANRFTRVSPTTAQHVERGLGNRVDLILDGGPTQVGIESTVVDLTGDPPRVLRPGIIAVPELERVLGRSLGLAPPTAPMGQARLSPGMVDRHYAPRAQVRLFGVADRAEAERVAHEAARRGEVVGAIVLGDAPGAVEHAIRLPPDPIGYAAGLYAALHRLDELRCHLILVEQVPPAPAWDGIRDRLARASR
ncbi:MAG: L-threonylcarbamoyladenylate synthase [Gemmatimonadota bacterium]